MSNPFEALPQENIYLKEYPKEFGNEAGEKMVSKLLESMPGCSLVKESSEYDDQKEGRFDLIMELENGSRLAIDVTDTIAFKIIDFVNSTTSSVGDAKTDVLVKFNPKSHAYSNGTGI